MSEASKPRYCIDCEHFQAGKYDDPTVMATCGKTGHTDLVSGQTTYWTCKAARMAYQACGPDGSRWEPRRATPVLSLVAEAAMLPEDVA